MKTLVILWALIGPSPQIWFPVTTYDSAKECRDAEEPYRKNQESLQKRGGNPDGFVITKCLPAGMKPE